MSICFTITCFPIQYQSTHFVSCTTLAPDLPFGMKSSGLGLSVAFVLVGVCSWLGGHPRSSPSLSSQALAMDCQQNIMQSINVLTAIPMIKMSPSADKCSILKFLTFHWVGWWVAQDIVPSLVHLVTEYQAHPPVYVILLPVAPHSGGALASSLPTPQSFVNPGHLLHLGGTTGKLNCQSSKRIKWIMECCFC